MAFTPRHVAFDPADHRPAPRRYAWSVFAVLFALMVVDYIDRQVVVSMFSHLKAQWDLSDSQLGALVSIVSITVALGAVPLSLLADRWSRVKSVFLMALIWSLATIACAFATSYGTSDRRACPGRRGRGSVRHRGRRAARESLSGADAQHGARRLPGGRHDRIGAGRRARRLHLAALGLAGGFRRGRHSRAGAVRRVPAGRTRLQDGGAALQGPHGEHAPAVRTRSGRRAAPAAHRARHVHRRRPQPAGGLDDLGMAAELSQPLLRPCARIRPDSRRASWCWSAASARSSGARWPTA